jgi:hypothetical protein
MGQKIYLWHKLNLLITESQTLKTKKRSFIKNPSRVPQLTVLVYKYWQRIFVNPQEKIYY